MEGKYKFDEGKYKNTFAEMFGSGAFDRGMSEADLLGRSTAQAKFAEQLYMARLQAAQEAASARSRRSYGGGYSRGGSGGSSSGGSSSKTGNKLADQFLKEKANAQLSPLEVYNNSERKKSGVSVVKNVPVTPIAKNKNLSPYEQMKLVQADAAWVKRNR